MLGSGVRIPHPLPISCGESNRKGLHMSVDNSIGFIAADGIVFVSDMKDVHGFSTVKQKCFDGVNWEYNDESPVRIVPYYGLSK